MRSKQERIESSVDVPMCQVLILGDHATSGENAQSWMSGHEEPSVRVMAGSAAQSIVDRSKGNSALTPRLRNLPEERVLRGELTLVPAEVDRSQCPRPWVAEKPHSLDLN